MTTVLGSATLSTLEVLGTTKLSTKGNNPFDFTVISRYYTRFEPPVVVPTLPTAPPVLIGKQGGKEQFPTEVVLQVPPLDFSNVPTIQTSVGVYPGSLPHICDLRITGDMFISIAKNFTQGLVMTSPGIVENVVPMQGGSIFVEGLSTVSLPVGRHFYCEYMSVQPVGGPPYTHIVFGPPDGTGAQFESSWTDQDCANFIVGNLTSDGKQAGFGATNWLARPGGYGIGSGTPITYPFGEGPDFGLPFPFSGQYSNMSYRAGPPQEFVIFDDTSFNAETGSSPLPILIPSPQAMHNALINFLGPVPEGTSVAVDVGVCNRHEESHPFIYTANNGTFTYPYPTPVSQQIFPPCPNPGSLPPLSQQMNTVWAGVYTSYNPPGAYPGFDRNAPNVGQVSQQGYQDADAQVVARREYVAAGNTWYRHYRASFRLQVTSPISANPPSPLYESSMVIAKLNADGFYNPN